MSGKQSRKTASCDFPRRGGECGRFISLNCNRLKPLPQFIPRRLRNRLKPLAEDLDIVLKEGWIALATIIRSITYARAWRHTRAWHALAHSSSFSLFLHSGVSILWISGRSIRYFYDNLRGVVILAPVTGEAGTGLSVVHAHRWSHTARRLFFVAFSEPHRQCLLAGNWTILISQI